MMDDLTNLVDVVSMLFDTLQSMHGSMTVCYCIRFMNSICQYLQYLSRLVSERSVAVYMFGLTSSLT